MAHRQIGIYKDIDIVLPEMRIGLCGWFDMEVYQCREMMDGRSIEIPGTRRRVASFPNVITNLGLDHIGRISTYGAYCHVGIGTAIEAITDTICDNFVASHAKDSGYDTVWSAQSTPPYYGRNQKKYRFSPNFAGGNIDVSEIGISTQAATGNLFSRALCKSGGVPAVVPVLSTEYLDVYYTLLNYPDHVNYTTGALDDGTGSFDVSGTSYSYTIRAEDVTYYANWGRNIFSGFGRWMGPSTTYKGMTMYSSNVALGPVTGVPTAADSAPSGYAIGTGPDQLEVGGYIDSTYSNTITYHVGLNTGNLTPLGIRGLSVYSTLGAYQMVLSASIPKDNTKLFNYTHRTTWTRKVLP